MSVTPTAAGYTSPLVLTLVSGSNGDATEFTSVTVTRY